MRFDSYKFKQDILLDEYYGTAITESASSLDDNELSFNIGLAYDINDAWTVGLGYAEAARGKQIGDGFTIDGYLLDDKAKCRDCKHVAEAKIIVSRWQKRDILYSLLQLYAYITLYNVNFILCQLQILFISS